MDSWYYYYYYLLVLVVVWQQRWPAHAFDSSSDVADAQKSCTGLESGRQNETMTLRIIWTGGYS